MLHMILTSSLEQRNKVSVDENQAFVTKNLRDYRSFKLDFQFGMINVSCIVKFNLKNLVVHSKKNLVVHSTSDFLTHSQKGALPHQQSRLLARASLLASIRALKSSSSLSS